MSLRTGGKEHDKMIKICNICGGEVIYTSNADIYGRKYGSGKCYLCTECKAYVGTHKPRPKEALGLLANERMRKGKIKCHGLFDKMWKTSSERRNLYKWLEGELGIESCECHFGYFDIELLLKAHKILCVKYKEINPEFTHCYEHEIAT